jgi:soluble P-type ATPase
LDPTSERRYFYHGLDPCQSFAYTPSSMLEIEIPGYGTLKLADLVLDYNGTLARDGELMAGVEDRLNTLSARLTIHVLTADTFGKASSRIAHLPCKLSVLGAGDQAKDKRDYVKRLGSDRTVAIGNGMNDRLMLHEARLGIAVLESEGTAVETLLSADIVATTILNGLDLLLYTKRLVATLRS